MWRANMIRMVDFKNKHESLIKISRRVFSRDYVPEDMFSLQWLVDNRQMSTATDSTDEQTPAENSIDDKPASNDSAADAQEAG